MLGYEGKHLVCFFWFIGFHCWSLGIHIDISRTPHIELHIPFGFIRIGCNPNKFPWPPYDYGWKFYKGPNWDKKRW